MKLVSFIGLFVLSFNALSSGTVDFLELEDNVVLFSTTENKQTSLACVASDKTQLWSLPLNTELGRAAYSLILTSMAKGDIALSVESAQDCGVLEGVERAQKITLVNNSATQSGGTKVAVYSGDDVRLGTFVYHANNQWHYLDEAGNKGNIATVVARGGSGNLMFQGFDCQGSPYIFDSSEWSLYIIPGFNNDFFYGSTGVKERLTLNSTLSTNGECTNRRTPLDTDVYTINYEARHQVCGRKNCYIKEE